MSTDCNEITSLLNNMGKSKHHLLHLIAWIDGKDSDEYLLYDKHIQTNNDLDLYISRFWQGDFDCTLEYILDFIDFKLIIDNLKYHGEYNEEIHNLLLNWTPDHISDFLEKTDLNESVAMDIVYYNFYTVEGGYEEGDEIPLPSLPSYMRFQVG